MEDSKEDGVKLSEILKYLIHHNRQYIYSPYVANFLIPIFNDVSQSKIQQFLMHKVLNDRHSHQVDALYPASISLN